MRFGRDLYKKPLISITDGRQIGQVKDLYLDEALRTLTGVHVGSEGLIRRKNLIIPREQIVVFGIDAVLVKNADVIVDDEQFTQAEQWTLLNKLRGKEMDTPGGTKVGTIGDIIIGEEGDITGFTLSKVFVEGPIAESGSVSRSALIDTGIHDDIITVDITKAEGPTLSEKPVVPDEEQ